MEYIIFCLIFIIASGLFSGFETVFISMDRIWLHSKIEAGENRAKILNFLLKNSDNTLGAFLVGSNLSDVATVLSFLKFLDYITVSPDYRSLINILILTPTILFFSTLIPKVIFREYANELALTFSYLFLIIYIILYPVQLIFTNLGKILMRLLKVKKKSIFSKDDFNHILKSYSSNILKDSEKDFIEKIMTIKKIKAKEIMVPLVRMSCVEENEPIKVALALMGATGLNRLPVFKIRVDNMTGYIEIKDLINAPKTAPISKFIRKGIYVTEFTPFYDILIKMKKENTHMAFVVDEYGGISGIITNQDLIKELISDYTKGKESLIHKEKDYWLANGMLSIDELNEELDIEIEHVEFETLSGLILYHLKKIPEQGEKIEIKNYIFEVLSTSQTRIKQVKIYKKKWSFGKWKNSTLTQEKSNQ
ncbi:MAG: hemolysin family protein [Brevinematia bacterium]